MEKLQYHADGTQAPNGYIFLKSLRDLYSIILLGLYSLAGIKWCSKYTSQKGFSCFSSVSEFIQSLCVTQHRAMKL